MAFLTTEEAAAYLGVSSSFLNQSRCSGRRTIQIDGPPWLKMGRMVRYDTHDLDAWAESFRTDSSGGEAS